MGIDARGGARAGSVAIEEFGVPGIVLMENAGRGCADILQQLGARGPVAICCGRGNNAGDGWCSPGTSNCAESRRACCSGPTRARCRGMRRPTTPSQWRPGCRWVFLEPAVGRGLGGSAARRGLDCRRAARDRRARRAAPAARRRHHPSESACGAEAGDRHPQRPGLRNRPRGAAHLSGRTHLHVRGRQAGTGRPGRPRVGRPVARSRHRSAGRAAAAVRIPGARALVGGALVTRPDRRQFMMARHCKGVKRAWKNRRYRGSYTIARPRAIPAGPRRLATVSATTSMWACVYTRRGMVSRTSSSSG
jgi:hypothetical protein